MAIRVLIVDDSHFFCRRIGSLLNKVDGISVIGVANNGREAIDKAAKLKPDVITLDVEMPVMDGVTALKEIVKVCEAKVLMLSSLTYENAKITLDALEAGATDFLLKSYESMSAENTDLARKLIAKINEIGGAKRFVPSRPLEPRAEASVGRTTQSARTVAQGASTAVPAVQRGQYRIVTIGASTGGPVALQKVLSPLPASFPLPITVTQHMPGTFTGAFATRLNSLCQLTVVGSAGSNAAQTGHVYVAPCGKQMVFEGTMNDARIRIRPSDARLQYAPCVDVTFASATKIYNGNILAVILTGMGSDGTDGSRLIKNKGGKIWAQDEASSVVYGMPMSVARAGLCDQQFAIDQFAGALTKAV